MPVFNVGDKPIETEASSILVEVNPKDPIPVGLHRFQLIVVDTDDNASIAHAADVLVKSLDRPTAKLEIRPTTVELGKNFTLVGEGSTDLPPGKIKSFHWQRIS